MQQLEALERKIEAILFAGGDPIEADKIAAALDIEENSVKNLIERIRDRYHAQQSPFDIVSLSGAYQMCTLPEYSDIIRAALSIRRNNPLSQAALEVLAVIAYNQPVTRAFVEQVRGVDCSAIIRNLAEKGLTEEAGRLNIPGKPIAYRTTAGFLRSFGLESLQQLPTLPAQPPDEPETDSPRAEIPQDGQLDFGV
ncbi:MAG: SMC-Scp complex subunit ScpB [Oscillospiraceae bacterium]|nr:SMC-Scp complex subunit ScpB [Oscillospiraceae bacterium]